MKPWIVHYRNKYPGGVVDCTDDYLAVYDAFGVKQVQVEKNGARQWRCMSAERGCEGAHDLAPIPRDARVWKLSLDGAIIKDELAAERAPVAAELAGLRLGGAGKVPSAVELACALNPALDPRGFTDTRWEWRKNRPEPVQAPALAAPVQVQLENKPAMPVDFQRVADQVPAELQSVL